MSSYINTASGLHSFVFPQKVNKFTWKWIVEKHPFAELTLDQFKQVASVSSGWRFVRDTDFRYSVLSSQDKFDQYVRRAMYAFDKDLYFSLANYSKVPRMGRAYHALLKYAGQPLYKDNLFDARMNNIWEENLYNTMNDFNPVGVIALDIIRTKIPTSTSAGFNFPGMTKGEAMDQACANVQDMIRRWSAGEDIQQIPTKLALRGHLSPEDENKTRMIWVSPIEHILLENMLFRGFTSQVATGYHFHEMFMTGQKTIERLNGYLADKPELSFVNTDISGWDAHRAIFITKDVFYKVLKPRINFTEPWHHKAFDYVVDAYIYTHLVLPDGSVFKKIGGVPSGSFLTLLVNSLAVKNVISSCLKYIDIEFSDTRVLGDDFCYKTPKASDSELEHQVDCLSSCVLDMFGLVIKPEKVIMANEINARKFIGYQLVNGVIFREDHELFAGMLYPEAPVKDLGGSFTRVFAYMVIGGFSSPRVCDFYDKFISGYYDSLLELGDSLFNQKIMRHGNLRVFKHVMDIDLDELGSLSITHFRRIFLDRSKHYLSNSTTLFY